MNLPKFWEYVVVSAILFAHAGIASLSARHQSLTYDEPAHYRYGRQILNLNSDRFDDSKMPFSAMNAIPVELAREISPNLLERIWHPMRLGRVVTIAFSTALALLIYHWAQSWYGQAAGITALLLYAFDPNFLAHGGLITTDVYAAGMMALSVYMFWMFLQQPGWKTASVSAITLGVAQLAKYTSFFLYPILLILLIIRVLFSSKVKESISELTDRRKVLAYVFFILVVSLLIINIGFLFNGTLTHFEDFEFHSREFRWAQENLPFLSRVPVPVPYPYLQGIDLVKFRDQTGEGYGNIYLLGQSRGGEDGGFPGYFFIASLLKVPLPTQMVVLVSTVTYLTSRKYKTFVKNEAFLLIPAIFLMGYFNFIVNAQIGIRLYLVVFPFLYVFGSRIMRNWSSFRLAHKVLTSVGVLWLIVSVLSYYPNYIPYHNELVVDRLRAYRYLSDSNIDYGQAEYFLERYMREHPEAALEAPQPQSGKIIVSVDRLTGVRVGPEWFNWLRVNLEPCDHIAHAYLVYCIQPETIDQMDWN